MGAIKEDKDKLDDLLEEYLAALERYQALQSALSAHLRTAHFDLAKAKMALGPASVGPKAFRLGETLPSATISSQDDSVALELQPYAARPKKKAKGDDATLPATKGGLRQRKKAEGGDEKLDPAETVHESASPLGPLDPILQFSAFPPPVLRAAQAGFISSLGDAVGMVQATAELQRIARSVKEYKETFA